MVYQLYEFESKSFLFQIFEKVDLPENHEQIAIYDFLNLGKPVDEATIPIKNKYRVTDVCYSPDNSRLD